jgi:hypothetical protein
MSVWRSARQRILTPDVAQTKVSVRGFHSKSEAAVDRLETVGESFLAGYAAAAGAARPGDIVPALDPLPPLWRGFAYEGAGMALGILDGLPGRGGRVAELLEGAGDRHVYMVYVGLGWAMARLPKFRWSVLHAPDPLLRWLVLDGYGFHQAYFHTQRYVVEQYQPVRFAWPSDGPSWHAAQVIDQGIGRASWFVGGTDPDRVAAIITSFPEHRQADLFAGAGLAATYAGGVERAELEHFAALAGPHLSRVAQGAAFAAEARLRAGLVVPHNELATEIFCGATVAEAAAATQDARAGLIDDASTPSFLTWRNRIADAFAAHTSAARAGR